MIEQFFFNKLISHLHFCFCKLPVYSFQARESFPLGNSPQDTAAAKQHQSCPTLCDPIDGSPPGSSVPGILPARTVEWIAISFSSAWKWKVKVKLLSRVRLFVTHGLQPSRLLRPWDFPGKSTEVGCHCLLRPKILGSIILKKSSFVLILQKHASCWKKEETV